MAGALAAVLLAACPLRGDGAWQEDRKMLPPLRITTLLDASEAIAGDRLSVLCRVQRGERELPAVPTRVVVTGGLDSPAAEPDPAQPQRHWLRPQRAASLQISCAAEGALAAGAPARLQVRPGPPVRWRGHIGGGSGAAEAGLWVPVDCWAEDAFGNRLDDLSPGPAAELRVEGPLGDAPPPSAAGGAPAPSAHRVFAGGFAAYRGGRYRVLCGASSDVQASPRDSSSPPPPPPPPPAVVGVVGVRGAAPTGWAPSSDPAGGGGRGSGETASTAVFVPAVVAPSPSPGGGEADRAALDVPALPLALVSRYGQPADAASWQAEQFEPPALGARPRSRAPEPAAPLPLPMHGALAPRAVAAALAGRGLVRLRPAPCAADGPHGCPPRWLFLPPAAEPARAPAHLSFAPHFLPGPHYLARQQAGGQVRLEGWAHGPAGVGQLQLGEAPAMVLEPHDASVFSSPWSASWPGGPPTWGHQLLRVRGHSRFGGQPFEGRQAFIVADTFAPRACQARLSDLAAPAVWLYGPPRPPEVWARALPDGAARVHLRLGELAAPSGSPPAAGGHVGLSVCPPEGHNEDETRPANGPGPARRLRWIADLAADDPPPPAPGRRATVHDNALNELLWAYWRADAFAGPVAGGGHVSLPAPPVVMPHPTAEQRLLVGLTVHVCDLPAAADPGACAEEAWAWDLELREGAAAPAALQVAATAAPCNPQFTATWPMSGELPPDHPSRRAAGPAEPLGAAARGRAADAVLAALNQALASLEAERWAQPAGQQAAAPLTARRLPGQPFTHLDGPTPSIPPAVPPAVPPAAPPAEAPRGAPDLAAAGAPASASR